jgi:hypothetical protein
VSTAGNNARRAALEEQANVVRAHLAEGIKALRERKRRLLDPVGEAKRHPEMAIALVAGTALVLGGAAVVVAHRVSTRKRRKPRSRLEGWAALLAPPPRIPSSPGFGMRVLEHAMMAAITALVSSGVKHYAGELLAKPKDRLPPRAVRVPDPFPSPAVSAPEGVPSTPHHS